jgi:hypothetical protein
LGPGPATNDIIKPWFNQYGQGDQNDHHDVCHFAEWWVTLKTTFVVILRLVQGNLALNGRGSAVNRALDGSTYAG